MGVEQSQRQGRRFSPGKVLGVVGAIVGLAAGISGLVFTFNPRLRPCLGNSNATITTTIVPDVRYRTYFIRHNHSKAEARTQPNQFGAEVRFTVEAESLRDHELAIKYSLFYVDKDGSLGPVADSLDRLPATTFRPASCSDQGGNDFFVPVPHRNRRYRILLELFRGPASNDRINLTESEVFRG